MQVLKTKLSRPTTLNSGVMQRPKLLTRLIEYSQQALVFIHAAAGYGKTTLMHQLSEQCVQQGNIVHWLTLDTDDNDPIRLYQYLCLSLLDTELQTTVPEGIINKHNVVELMEKIAQPTQQHVLFIDEFEVLENIDCLNIIWWMYQYLPNNCHLVIASRVKPNWSFSKEVLKGRLHFVNEDMLSIKSEESTQLIEFLIQQNFEHVALNIELTELLINKTEGWITGIQLTNLYLKQDHDANSIIHNLSGAHNQIVDYLSEQVFLQQSEEIQSFLLQMSVLRKMNLALIQVVTGHPHAQDILEQIKQRGLFILALDEQHLWYRVHHLFRDFLENRFKMLYLEQFKQTHSKAAHWYKEQHFLMEAIYHAEQADDQVLALELLTTVSRELVLEGRIYTLLELVKKLPEQVLITHSHLLYDIIWSLLLTHQNTLANYYLRLWHSAEKNQQLMLKDDQLGLAPMVAFLEDNLALAYELAQKNLEKLPETAYFARGPLIGFGALYHISLGNVSIARQLLIQTRATYIQGYNLHGLIFTDCIDATFERLLGNLTLAEAKFNQIGKGIDYQKLGVDDAHHVMIDSISSSFKADLYYEMNKIDLAEQTLQKFNGGDQLVIPDMVIIGYVLQLRLAYLHGNIAFEQTCLTQSQIRSNTWSMPRLAKTVQIIYAHQQALKYIGSKQGALLALPTSELLDQFQLLNMTNLLIGDDLFIYRALILNGKIEQAIEGLQKELHRITVYPLRKIRIQLLQALAHYRIEQTEVALTYLEQALIALMPTQAVRIILDEYPLIEDMLIRLSQVLLASKQHHATSLLEYIQHLFPAITLSSNKAFENDIVMTVNQPQLELLSKREIQLLEKVSQGLTDAEIAKIVFLSVNTVKWHLRNIYNKLDVRSRLEAVQEAKKIGLIS